MMKGIIGRTAQIRKPGNSSLHGSDQDLEEAHSVPPCLLWQQRFVHREPALARPSPPVTSLIEREQCSFNSKDK
jgi:hypothetical protein